MQKMWNPLGMPIPGFGLPVPRRRRGRARLRGSGAGMPFPNPAAMFATLDPPELERKIGELRVVETGCR
jgi:hypothetical protein